MDTFWCDNRTSPRRPTRVRSHVALSPRRSLPSLQIPLAASHVWRPIRKCHTISPASLIRCSSSCHRRRPHPLCANAATRTFPALLPLPHAKPWTSARTLGPALLHLPFDPHRYRSTEYKLDGARANSSWLGHHWYVISQFPSSDIGHGEGCRLHKSFKQSVLSS